MTEEIDTADIPSEGSDLSPSSDLEMDAKRELMDNPKLIDPLLGVAEPASLPLDEMSDTPTETAQVITGLPSCGFMTEKNPGKGEDSHPFEYVWETESGKRTLLAVFDGMGGAGSRKVTDPNDESVVMSMAYFASRAARGALVAACNQVTPMMTPREITDVIEHEIKKALRRLADREGGIPTGGIRGSMVKDYPTTVAIALIDEEVDRRRVHMMWAGDSRVYAMWPDKDYLLQQLTLDHTASGASSDGGDAALTKCATPDSAELEFSDIDVPKNAVVFVATDGCFAYESTQFFLCTLVEEMMHSSNVVEYSENLAATLSAIAGDDCSMAMSFRSDSEFPQTKSEFKDHLRPLQEIRNVPKHNPFITFSSGDLFLRHLRNERGV